MALSRIKVWISRGLIVSVAPTVTFCSRFARNVILSRLLVSDQFGTAVAISVVIGLAGLVTDAGLDRFVMINNSAKALSAAHALQIARGGLLALALVVCAPLTAALFGIPQFANSFALAALVPLVGGFAHLGIKRIQANYEYGPESVAQLVANIAAIAAVFLAAAILRDHRAIIASFLTESITYVILSHVLAPVPYHLRSDRAMLRAALSFGLPLTINGIALASISQLDRVMVGYWFGVETLGTYAVILSMAVTPVSLILRIFGALGLPYLLAAGDDSSVNSRNYQLLVFFYSTLALLYALWVVLTLDVLTPLVFGSTFVVPPVVHALMAVIVFFRVQRGGAPTIALLASGRTRELALLNLPSAFGLLCALGFVFLWPNFESIVLGVAIGDFIGLSIFFFVSSTRVMSRHTVTIDFAISLSALAAVIGTFSWIPQITWQARGAVFLVGMLGIGVQLAFGLQSRILSGRVIPLRD
jgi:O-antigen/teichoic acid export membrane protein